MSAPLEKKYYNNIVESVDSISRDGPDCPYVYNTLRNQKYLSLCTDSGILIVIIVTYVWNTTSIHIAAPSKTADYILNQIL